MSLYLSVRGFATGAGGNKRDEQDKEDEDAEDDCTSDAAADPQLIKYSSSATYESTNRKKMYRVFYAIIINTEEEDSIENC